ncbi:hypothetical protein [Actinacidiphila glaucinigra]|uniref:hypothetical protein n=1 Tax=Actinacidiphila glaucinigra TaxID=235986 RepID=UPI002E3169E5|nr:hypothetical protein [Actinacidiphila glaucinigra]
MVWQEAFGEMGWPSFRLVDRRLHQYGIDIVEVLRFLPAHFLVGWPDRSRTVPAPDAPMQLTIAGAAQCPGSADVVNTFVSLVRTLARLEAHWPTDDPSSVAGLRSQDAAAELGLTPGVESKELLRRAFLLSIGEPWSYYSNSGPVGSDGREGWELRVERDIRAYADIGDIGDYWEQRSKQRSSPGWLLPTAPPSVSELFTPQRMAEPDLEGHAAQLVVWLFEQAEGDTTKHVRLDEFAAEYGVDEVRLHAVLEHAARQGAVEVLGTLGGGRGTQVRLTVVGLARAEQVARARGKRWIRFDYLTSALVTAAMDTYPMCRLKLADFLASPVSILYGSALTVDEVLLAVEYLREKGLAELEYGQGGPAQALRLTSAGIDCGSTDIVNVRNFVSNQPGFSIGTVNNYGGANQIGTGNTQHNTMGTTAQDLAEFAQKVLAAAQTIDLSDQQRAQLVQDAQALANEAATPEPEPGRLRQLTSYLRESLTQHAADAVVQGLLNTAQNLF